MTYLVEFLPECATFIMCGPCMNETTSFQEDKNYLIRIIPTAPCEICGPETLEPEKFCCASCRRLS